MSVSEKQLLANRANAKKSNGPMTAEGKAVSSRNAIKHGLYAADIIINSPHLKEDPDDYDYLLSSLFDELKPVGVFQEQLVHKIANCLWRSRRAISAETARINRQLDNIDHDLAEHHRQNLRRLRDNPDHPARSAEQLEQTRADLIGCRTIPDLEYCRNILRYEMRLDRQMDRAFKLLRLLKDDDTEMTRLA
nr:hypothetical protein [candidate division Zixibacteria bacterium]